jgi:hypothetical protein
VQLYSRKHHDFTKRFPVIAQAVSALDNVTLDGEIVALDEHGHPRFEWRVNRGPQKRTIVYYVFDLLRLGDKDLRPQRLYRRKSLLQKLLKKNDTLRYVDHIETHGLGMYAGALGLEGIVAKDAKSPYVEGPVQTWHWQKIKNRNTSGRERWSFGSLRQGNESEHGSPGSRLFKRHSLGHPPACDQDGSNDKESEEGKEGNANHEGRGFDFFNLFQVGLEVDHFTTIRLGLRKSKGLVA